MGEAEEEADADILAKKLMPKVNILKIAHHGATE
jgi:hypothetical protein